MVDVSKFGDAKLDPTDPEALVYERRNDGTLKLVALEYIVFQSAVSSGPSLFGVPFDANDGSRFGLPPFWALHRGSGSRIRASRPGSSTPGIRE